MVPVWEQLSLILLITYTCTGNYCPANFFGSQCQLRCHCKNDDKCRENCQTCNVPYDQPPKCQRRNLAYMMPTLHRSTSGGDSALGVDNDELTCSQTELDRSNWWQVDLRKSHPVTWLEIFNRYIHRDYLRGFTVYVSNTSMTQKSIHPPNDAVHCYTDTTTPKAFEGLNSILFTCDPVSAGRYVIVYMPQNNILSICELKVFYCEDFTYGGTCLDRCNCRDVTEVCNKITGECKSGCKFGLTGIDCQSYCRFGTFGPNCSEKCHCNEGICVVTDSCVGQGGCIAGWSSAPGLDNCQIACANGTFGVNCSSTCHCLIQSSCRPTDGACITGGCAPGYRNTNGSRNCQTPCAASTFGVNCSKTCHCNNADEPCALTDGKCISGCAQGWTGNRCQIHAPSTSPQTSAITTTRPAESSTTRRRTLRSTLEPGTTMQTSEHVTVERTTVEHTTVERTTVEHTTVERTTVERTTVEHTTVEHTTVERTMHEELTSTRLTTEEQTLGQKTPSSESHSTTERQHVAIRVVTEPSDVTLSPSHIALVVITCVIFLIVVALGVGILWRWKHRVVWNNSDTLQIINEPSDLNNDSNGNAPDQQGTDHSQADDIDSEGHVDSEGIVNVACHDYGHELNVEGDQERATSQPDVETINMVSFGLTDPITRDTTAETADGYSG